MLTIGYVGNGKSTNRYHLPYVLARPDTLRVKTIYRRNPAHDQWAAIPGVHYTSDLNELLNDSEIDLVCVCTSSEHYEMAKQVLLHGKHCLVEKPFTQTLAEAENLYNLARAQGVLIEPYQNRRYDSDFLTVCSILESGKLGQIYEIESSCDYYRPKVPERIQTFLPEQSFLYTHACHLLDRMLSLFGSPQQVTPDVRQLLGAGRMNDYFDVDLHYPGLKVSLRSSYFRIRQRPSFTSYLGVELLIHVGMDTIKMNGKGFDVRVEQGMTVHQGDPVLDFSLSLIHEAQVSDVVAVIVTNADQLGTAELLGKGFVSGNWMHRGVSPAAKVNSLRSALALLRGDSR